MAHAPDPACGAIWPSPQMWGFSSSHFPVSPQVEATVTEALPMPPKGKAVAGVVF